MKINIGGIEFEMTEERRSKIEKELLATNELIAKEMAYSEDLRNKSYLDQLNQHVSKLNGYLQGIGDA